MKNQYILYSAMALMISGFANQTACSQDFRTGQVITTAVPSLRIPVDARAGGMGEAGIAVSADASSGFRNLAKTAFAANRSALAVNYTPWMPDVSAGMYLLSLSGYHRPDTLRAITASVRYFNLGDFALQDNNGNLLQTTRPHDLLMDIGYARRLSDRLALGLAFRYINSNLANGTSDGINYKPGESVAADVSLFYNGLNEAGQGFSAGLAFTNLGARISYTGGASKEFIPANLGLGAAYTTVLETDHRITLAADINKLMVPKMPADDAKMQDYYNMGLVKSWTKSFDNNAFQYSLGAEYSYQGMLSLRSGYFLENKSQGNRKGLTAGVGLRYQAFQVDLSYMAPSGNGATRSPLSNTLHLGLQWVLNGREE